MVPGARSGPAPVTWSVTAVEFASIPGFPTRWLVAGADTARRTDLAMMVWLLRSSEGRLVLVDAGFDQSAFIEQWHPEHYQLPDAALRRAGVDPAGITDVIVSHIHWDHVDGLDRFPQARVWLQRDEYEYYVGAEGEPLHRAIDSLDAARLYALHREGRLTLVDGDAQEILPGLTCYTGGRHTWASQYVGVETPVGTIVVASDNAYLYENLEQHRPIAQTLDSLSNLRAQARMLALAGGVLDHVVPGHDPDVFRRFPEPGGGVARIE